MTKIGQEILQETCWLVLRAAVYFSCKLYGMIPTRYPASFWTSVFVTMLILLGPAVEDSASGQDDYMRFAVHMGMFIAVTLYAWAGILVLESLRTRRGNGSLPLLPADRGSSVC